MLNIKKSSTRIYFTAIFPVLFVGVVSLIFTQNNLTKEALQRRDSTAFLGAKVLNEKLERVEDLGISLTTRVKFRKLIEQGKFDGAVDIVHDVPHNFKFISALHLLSVDGSELKSIPLSTKKNDYSRYDWFNQLDKTLKPTVSNLYESEQEKKLSYTFPIRKRGDESLILGFLVLDIDVNSFVEWSQNHTGKSEGILYFIDANNHLIGGSSEVKDEDVSTAISEIILAEKNSVKENVIVSSKNNHVIAFYNIPTVSWLVVFDEKKDAVFGAMYKTLLFLGAVFSIIISITVVLARRQVKANKIINASSKKIIESAATLKRKNQELSNFSSMASHDLKAPIRGISLLSHMLLEDCDYLKADDREMLVKIEERTKKMSQLVDGFLSLAQAGEVDTEPTVFDLPNFLESMVKELSAEKEVQLNYQSRLQKVFIEQFYVQQVFQNLFSNSIKHADKSKVCLTLKIEESLGKYYFDLCDDGPGIPESSHQEIFKPYKTLHQEGASKGHGVGLAIVQKIVSIKSGSGIEVYTPTNRVGVGFRFSLAKGSL